MSIPSEDSGSARLQRMIGGRLGSRHYGRSRWLTKPKVLTQLARRLYAYYRGVDSTAPPVAVAWDLHYACNARCAFCGTHERHRQTGAPSRERAAQIAHIIGRAGVPIVGLTGGEPLLSKHLVMVVEILRNHGVEVQLSTNGSTLAEHADTLIRLGVASVTVSVDSLYPLEHDRIRSLKGLHARLWAGLEALRRHPLAHRISRRVRLVVTANNFDQMVAFAEAWRPQVDEVCFQPLMRHGELLRGTANASGAERLRGPPDFYGPSDPRRARFEAEMRRLMDRYPEFRTGYYRRMAAYLFAPEEVKDTFFCLVPTLMLQVFANGDASLCTSDGVIGNLLCDPLPKIWNHPAARALRAKSRRRTRDCFCYCQWIRANDALPAWAGRLPTTPRESGPG